MLLIGILIFLVVRGPYKISEPYDNPFCEFSNGGAKKKKKKKKINTKNSGLPKFAPLVACTPLGPRYVKVRNFEGTSMPPKRSIFGMEPSFHPSSINLQNGIWANFQRTSRTT